MRTIGAKQHRKPLKEKTRKRCVVCYKRKSISDLDWHPQVRKRGIKEWHRDIFICKIRCY